MRATREKGAIIVELLKRTWRRTNTRLGFATLLVILFWLKTLIAYFVDFKITLNDPLQVFLYITNPIATTVILFSLALYVRPTRLFYTSALVIDILNTVLLYLNVIYYREFTDFMTVSTMLGYNKVNQGLSGSSMALTSIHDIFFWLDLVVVVILLFTRRIKIDTNKLNWRASFAVTSVGFLLLGLNFSISEMNRPQLMTKTFDRSYIVKYLGLDSFTVFDGITTQHNNDIRKTAKKNQN